MGILSDPTSTSAQRSKYSKILIKGNRIICFLFYIAGIIWFCALGHTDFNNPTYFSENALLPGNKTINSSVLVVKTACIGN